MKPEMVIRGFTLPDDFITCIESGILDRNTASWWELSGERDAYGNILETQLADVYDTAERIEQESRRLPGLISREFEWRRDEISSPAEFIPDVNDFSRILAFANASNNEPFCFDYRKSVKPSVIWWDELRWRRVAPNFTAFLKLFRLRDTANWRVNGCVAGALREIRAGNCSDLLTSFCEEFEFSRIRATAKQFENDCFIYRRELIDGEEFVFSVFLQAINSSDFLEGGLSVLTDSELAKIVAFAKENENADSKSFQRFSAHFLVNRNTEGVWETIELELRPKFEEAIRGFKRELELRSKGKSTAG